MGKYGYVRLTTRYRDVCSRWLLVKDAIKLAVYAESFGGPLQMTDEITYFITHWEAEAYRSKK